MVMMPARRVTIEGLDLFVFDGIVGDVDIRKVERQVRYSGFSSRSSSSKKSEKFREWVGQFEVEDFLAHPVYLAACKCFEYLYPELNFEFWDVHCNNTIFGDWAFAHRDSNERGAYSALYYANRKWQQDWFGETVFCCAGEPVVSVSVRPGRLVLFDSRIEHRAGVPAMNSPAQRLTLSLRFDAHRVGNCALGQSNEVY